MSGVLDALDRERTARVDAWLDEALELDEDGRQALLARARGEDALAGEALARLLAALDGDSALDRPPLARAPGEAPAPRAALAAGTRLGAWRIEALAGRGGMASVYRAARADGAYAQRVALKLLDTADPELARRFATERKLLAALEHPHIARLLDAGIADDGRLWFAMTWVEGRDLDAHLLAARPTLEQRLELFAQIADALAHAHRQLIVHRDLKPANVRISTEGKAVLLDFGIARLSAGDTAEAATRPWMTPEYAAPEQLSGAPIGTWTDVHGLGLLLYQMLSGRHAFAGARASLAATVQAIVSQPPVALSTAAQGVDLPYPPRALRGDLDAIVARCLEKEPSRRYASVDALREDLDRHRRLQPVLARHGARRYRIGRWLQRHWLASALAALALFSAAAGLSAFVVQAGRVAAERDAARLEVRRQEALREHLMLVFREGAAQGGDASAKELLDASAAQLDAVYGHAPELRRSVLLAMGELYFTLGDYPAARAMLERFLAAAGPDTAAVDRVLGHLQQAQVLLRLGEREGARIELAAAETLRAGFAGPPRDLDAQLLAARSQLARAEGDLEGGIALQRQAVAATASASDASAHRLGIAESNLGMALLQAHRIDESREHFERALRVFAEAGYSRSVHAITTLGNLANVESLLGRYTDAGQHYRDAEALATAATAESATMAALFNNHARLLLALDLSGEALPRAERARALAERYVGPDSLDVGGMRLTLAEIALAAADPGSAQESIAAARAIYAARLPETHPLIARAELIAARIALTLDPDASLDPLIDAVHALETAPALLARQSVRGAVWIAEAALARDELELARRTLDRTVALPLYPGLPEADRAEVRLWQALAASTHPEPDDPHPDSPFSADLRLLQQALGPSHPRLAAIHQALSRRSR